MEQLKEFVEKAKSDKVLGDKVKKLDEKNAADEEYITLAADAGFTITADELNETKKKRELRDEELESVAGGVGDNDQCFFTPTGKTKDAPVPEKGYNAAWAECNSTCIGFLWDCSCFHTRYQGEPICVNKWHRLSGRGNGYLSPEYGSNHVKKHPPSYNT